MYRRLGTPRPGPHSPERSAASGSRGAAQLEVYLVHSGGPYFERERDRHWGIPKGIVEDGEDTQDAARREFAEETGFAAPADLIDLGTVVTRRGRLIHAYAGEWVPEGDPPQVRSNTCTVEWPVGSGVRIHVPEIDEGRFFPIDAAREVLGNVQAAFLGRLVEALSP